MSVPDGGYSETRRIELDVCVLI